MRPLIRLLLLLWITGAILITAATRIARIHAEGPVSPLLLYTVSDPGGATTIERIRPVPGNRPQRLNADFVDVLFPVWSSDGQWIAFLASGEVINGRAVPRYFDYSIYRMRANGSDLQELMHLPQGITPSSLVWSADGTAVEWTMLLGGSIDYSTIQQKPISVMITGTFRTRIGRSQLEYWQPDRAQWEPFEPEDIIDLLSPYALYSSTVTFNETPVSAQGWIVVPRSNGSTPGIYRIRPLPDGTPDPAYPPELLLPLTDQVLSLVVSPDGQTVLLSSMGAGGGKVFRLEPSTGRAAQILHDKGHYLVMNLTVAPDGQQVALEAHRSGFGGIYLLPLNSASLRPVDDLPLLISGSIPYNGLAWAPPTDHSFRWAALLVIGVLLLWLTLRRF